MASDRQCRGSSTGCCVDACCLGIHHLLRRWMMPLCCIDLLRAAARSYIIELALRAIGTIRLPKLFFDLCSKLVQILDSLSVGHLRNDAPRLFKAAHPFMPITRWVHYKSVLTRPSIVWSGNRAPRPSDHGAKAQRHDHRSIAFGGDSRNVIDTIQKGFGSLKVAVATDDVDAINQAYPCSHVIRREHYRTRSHRWRPSAMR